MVENFAIWRHLGEIVLGFVANLKADFAELVVLSRREESIETRGMKLAVREREKKKKTETSICIVMIS